MKHAVIAGGGAALAQPLIRRFLCHGYEVTAVCRSTDPRVGACHVVKSVCDVDKDINILVTLTGSTDDTKLCNMFSKTENSWDRVIEDTLNVPARAMSDAFLRMLNGGNVVVVGSVVGSMGGYGCTNYAAAKAGLVGLVRGAANEWAKHQIMVNLLELGYVDSGMGAELNPRVRDAAVKSIPLGRFATEEDFVHAVEYLATTRYATGTVLTLAGGLR